MSFPIQFYLDEHIPNAVAEGMRRRGVDVLTISEAGKLGASDEEHFALAKKQGRVIVTHDTDFLRLAADSSDHAGVVFAPQERTIGEMVRILSLIARVLDRKDMRGHTEYI